VPRGYLVSEYVDDNGTPWRLLVDADYALDPARGWVTGAVEGMPPLPRMWFPRYVVGVDESGRYCRTRVGSVDAPLWTGAATTFVVNATDETPHTATVIKRVGERRRL
jgi:hypothetical protein